MQSGSPSFGTPGVGHRPAVHRPARPPLRAAVPHRRRPQLQPDRGRAGGVRVADDAAADVPGRHQLRHARGRVARGRPGQLLREVHHRHRAAAHAAGRVHPAGDRRGVAGLRRARGGRATAATSSGPQHTMERFRECFYRPLLSSTANYERWVRLGAKDATARAGEICAKTLADYEPPPLDDAIRAETRGVRDPAARGARRLAVFRAGWLAPGRGGWSRAGVGSVPGGVAGPGRVAGGRRRHTGITSHIDQGRRPHVTYTSAPFCPFWEFRACAR